MKKIFKLTLALSIFAATISVSKPEATFEGDVEAVSASTTYTGVLNTTYSTTADTNQNVVVTVELEDANYKFLNNTGVSIVSDTEVQITFTENGTFYGNIDNVIDNSESYQYSVNVDWINKNSPTANFTRDILDNTVVYTLDTTSTDFDSVIKYHTVTNNEGSFTYTFTENGSFTFEFVDQFGNVGSTSITETSIVEVVDEIIEGANQTIDVSQVDSLIITSNAEFSNFTAVLFDGKVLSSEYYTISEGSIIVNISAIYLNTLLDGVYDVAVQSTTGIASTKVTLVNTVLSMLGTDYDEYEDSFVEDTFEDLDEDKITTPITNDNVSYQTTLNVCLMGLFIMFITYKKEELL